MPDQATPTFPPPLPQSFGSSRRPLRTSRIAAIAILLLTALLAAEYAWLRARQEARAIVRDNERVTDRIELARAHLAAQHWEEAIRHLEDARAMERATNREEAASLLERAKRGQAESLLEAARVALAHKDSANALRLLHAYEVHPWAADLDRAHLLRKDLERATSSEEAVRLLAHLSEDALALFSQHDRLAEDDGLHTDGAREIFKDTLRRHLRKEIQRRQARRELQRLTAERRAADRARQIARLRATPAFRDLSTFIAQTLTLHHEQQQIARRQEADLAQLFQQLGVNDEREQAALRADLMESEGGTNLVESVDRQRAAIKRAYRSSPAFDTADRELFDRLVDEALDNLLKMLKPS
jgi:hypothetical protein